MRKNGLHIAIIFVVGALMLLTFQATSIAREFKIEGSDQAYPLGFDYSPLPVNDSQFRLRPAVYDNREPALRLTEITHDQESADAGYNRWSTGSTGSANSGVEMKTAFKTLQNLRKEDARLAHGNLNLLSLFDTVEGVPDRQVGVDFLSEQLEDEKQEMPETLAMLLLGTGLIGLARIQRKRMQD